MFKQELAKKILYSVLSVAMMIGIGFLAIVVEATR
jgi:hypothetical protein